MERLHFEDEHTEPLFMAFADAIGRHLRSEEPVDATDVLIAATLVIGSYLGVIEDPLARNRMLEHVICVLREQVMPGGTA